MKDRIKLQNSHASALVDLDDWVMHRGLSPRIQNRVQMCKGFGVFGWDKWFEDCCIHLWDELPSEDAISLSDEIARSLGADEAFFELYDADFGGPGDLILSWVIEKGIEWLAGRSLKALLQKANAPHVIELATKLKNLSEFHREDGVLIIKIRGAGLNIEDVRVSIENYPSTLQEQKIDPKAIDELTEWITKSPVPHYRYDKSGRFVEDKSYSNNVFLEG